MSLDDFGGFDDTDLELPEDKYRSHAADEFDFPTIEPIEDTLLKHPLKTWLTIGQLHYLEETNEVALVGRKVRENHLYGLHKGYAISTSVLQTELPKALDAAKDEGAVPDDATLRYFMAYEVDNRDIYCYTLDQYERAPLIEHDPNDPQRCVPLVDAHKTWPNGVDKVIQLGKHQLVFCNDDE
jgi:hypothetical protein